MHSPIASARRPVRRVAPRVSSAPSEPRRSHPGPSGEQTTVVVDPVREFLNLPDDASADPDPALFERLLVWRAALEPVVVTWLYQAVAEADAAQETQRAARASAEVRYGYRMVYAIALLARWRTEPAVPALVDWIRRPRRWGVDDAIGALVHIGPATHDALWRAMIDVEGDDVGRAHSIRTLTAVVRDTALQSAGEVAHPMPVLQPHPAVVRLSERLLALVQDPAAGVRTRHEAALRLCDLRQAWAWPCLLRQVRLGRLTAAAGFDMESARDLMRGRALSLDLPSRWTFVAQAAF